MDFDHLVWFDPRPANVKTLAVISHRRKGILHAQPRRAEHTYPFQSHPQRVEILQNDPINQNIQCVWLLGLAQIILVSFGEVKLSHRGSIKIIRRVSWSCLVRQTTHVTPVKATAQNQYLDVSRVKLAPAGTLEENYPLPQSPGFPLKITSLPTHFETQYCGIAETHTRRCNGQ